MRYLWENAILRTLLIVALLIWLTSSALLYAHLFVVQSMLPQNANSNGGDWLVSVSWCRKEKERWRSARRSDS